MSAIDLHLFQTILRAVPHGCLAAHHAMARIEAAFHFVSLLQPNIPQLLPSSRLIRDEGPPEDSQGAKIGGAGAELTMGEMGR